MSFKSVWNEAVVQNPLRSDFRRFANRYLKFRGPSVAVNGVLGLAITAYILFVAVIFFQPIGLKPNLLLDAYSGLVWLVAPLSLHQAIAGERDRRSWDLIMVAPLSPLQIIVGKFLTAGICLVGCLALVVLPIMLSFLRHSTFQATPFLMQACIALCHALAVSAISLFASARSTRPVTALTTSLLVSFALTIGTWMTAMTGSFSAVQPVHVISAVLNPFYLGARSQYVAAAGPRFGYPDDPLAHPAIMVFGNPSMIFGCTCLIYLAVTVICITWASKTLHYADQGTEVQNG